MTRNRFPQNPVLLVDDEEQALLSFDIALRSGGLTNVVSCSEPKKVVPILDDRPIDVIVLDLWMPQLSGEEILEEVSQRHPEIPVIVVTGVDDVETAVRCMKMSAFDYLVKPVGRDRLVATVKRAIEVRELRLENSRLRERLLSERLDAPEAFAHIVSRDRHMLSIFSYIEAIARTSQPVLIEGETGVGKELMARAVHACSGRNGDFIAVNVAGLDDVLFSDTLFGHLKGAYTSAQSARSGLVEHAAGGTLFLDEIGDLSPQSQVKLLRLLQEKEFFPLGADIPKRSSARVVVATNQNLDARQREGTFRSDLYYRLRTHRIRIPPLRDRVSDLPLLLNHFLAEIAKDLDKRTPTYPPELLTLLRTYDFPGNVREFKSLVYDAVSTHTSGVLSLESFRDALGLNATSGASSDRDDLELGITFSTHLPTLKQAEETLIAEALKRSDGNQSIAARLLGISRQALNRRLNHPRK